MAKQAYCTGKEKREIWKAYKKWERAVKRKQRQLFWSEVKSVSMQTINNICTQNNDNILNNIIAVIAEVKKNIGR